MTCDKHMISRSPCNVLEHTAPSEVINQEDLQQAAGTDLWVYDCRCGGKYIIDNSELHLYMQTLLPCDTCSLHVCLDTSSNKPPQTPKS